jgi:hypothetical protein
MSSDLIPIPLRQLGRAGPEKLPELTCSVEYASTFHSKDLPSRNQSDIQSSKAWPRN